MLYIVHTQLPTYYELQPQKKNWGSALKSSLEMFRLLRALRKDSEADAEAKAEAGTRSQMFTLCGGRQGTG